MLSPRNEKCIHVTPGAMASVILICGSLLLGTPFHINEDREFSKVVSNIDTDKWDYMVSLDLKTVLDFSICLENWKFSLKSAWKSLFMGLKNSSIRNLTCLCVFCTFNFDKLKGFGNFVIKYPVTTDPVIGIFQMANIVICFRVSIMLLWFQAPLWWNLEN